MSVVRPENPEALLFFMPLIDSIISIFVGTLPSSSTMHIGSILSNTQVSRDSSIADCCVVIFQNFQIVLIVFCHYSSLCL